MAAPRPGTSGPPSRARFVLLLVGLALFGCCGILASATDVYHAATEHHGTVTAGSCAAEVDSRGRSHYRCVGEFVSNDGTLRVSGVRFRSDYRLDAGDTTRVTLAGGGATEAHPVDPLRFGIGLGIAAVALAGIVLAVVRYRARAGAAFTGRTARSGRRPAVGP